MRWHEVCDTRRASRLPGTVASSRKLGDASILLTSQLARHTETDGLWHVLQTPQRAALYLGT